MPNMTTAKHGIFRVEDVTLKNPRQQIEVAREIAREKGVSSDASVAAPVSMTPESVKTYYERKVDTTTDTNERRVFEQTIQWIDELFALRKKVVQLEMQVTNTPPEPVGDGDDISTAST